MELWTPEMTQMLVSTAITILVPYLIYAAERYLKVRLDEVARATLDTAMRNGADWIIREGRLPTPAEVLQYVDRAAPDAVARWHLDSSSRDIAEARAQAVIGRALQAAGSERKGEGRERDQST